MSTTTTNRLFSLGTVMITRGMLWVLEQYHLDRAALYPYLHWHQTGDWSDMDADDQQSNVLAVKHRTRIFSSYRFQGITIWIITEWDRSSTTVMLPEEY